MINSEYNKTNPRQLSHIELWTLIVSMPSVFWAQTLRVGDTHVCKDVTWVVKLRRIRREIHYKKVVKGVFPRPSLHTTYDKKKKKKHSSYSLKNGSTLNLERKKNITDHQKKSERLFPLQ